VNTFEGGSSSWPELTRRPIYTTKVPPKHIQVGGQDIRFAFLQNKAWLVIGGYMCVLAVSGAYFAATQVHYYYWPGHSAYYWPGHQLSFKTGWDSLIHKPFWEDGTWRHGVRNVGEGVAALLIGVKALAGAWRKYYAERVSDLELVLRAIATLIVGIGLIIGALWIATFGVAMIQHRSFHVHYETPPAKTAEYIYIAIGLVVGLIVSKLVWRRAGTAIQRYLAEQSVAWWERLNRMPVWIYLPLTPPALRQEVSWIFGESVPCRKHAFWVAWLLPFMAPAFLGFMVIGFLARFTTVLA
jgi:hypothetical protein